MPVEIPTARLGESLADYTRPELIIPRLHAADPLGVIEELSRCLREQEIIGDLFSFYHAAVNHEFLCNSALRSGLAVPHARSSQVNRLMMAVGRASRPMTWGGKGSWPVDHVFLLAVPSTAAQEHLSLLSGIAGFANQPEMLARLRAATGAHGMFEILTDVKTAS